VTPATAADRARAERLAAGLPSVITDPVVIESVVRIVRAAGMPPVDPIANTQVGVHPTARGGFPPAASRVHPGRSRAAASPRAAVR
jgi:hypothetical protein